MYTKRNLLFFFIISIFMVSNVFAQNQANASANVKVKLTKGLVITNETGDLDFGERILGTTDETYSIPPSNGVKFNVTGHPGKNILVNFDETVDLNNSSWATTNGVESSNLTFAASVEHSGNSESYVGGTGVSNAGGVNLVNSSGVGQLYLWLGGNIC